MDPTLEKRILACPNLPSLPAAALELLQLCRGDAVDLRKVADLLAKDPALAARALRAANSALTGWGEVRQLTRAVTLLGSKTVVSLALTFSLVRSRRRGSGSGGFDHEAFWRRALYSAIAARALAERWRVDPEEAFLAGLLQDLGVLAMAEVFRHEYGDAWTRSEGQHARLCAAERARTGITHVEVGHLLARSWRLPAALQEATLHSHQLPPAAEPRPLRLAECAFLAGLIADIWIDPHPADAVQGALEAARGELAMSRDSFSQVLARVATLIPEVEADLEVSLATEERVEEVMAQARAALAALRPGPAPAATATA
jgi:HD-like signal output (HDOD) protein